MMLGGRGLRNLLVAPTATKKTSERVSRFLDTVCLFPLLLLIAERLDWKASSRHVGIRGRFLKRR